MTLLVWAGLFVAAYLAWRLVDDGTRSTWKADLATIVTVLTLLFAVVSLPWPPAELPDFSDFLPFDGLYMQFRLA